MQPIPAHNTACVPIEETLKPHVRSAGASPAPPAAGRSAASSTQQTSRNPPIDRWRAGAETKATYTYMYWNESRQAKKMLSRERNIIAR